MPPSRMKAQSKAQLAGISLFHRSQRGELWARVIASSRCRGIKDKQSRKSLLVRTTTHLASTCLQTITRTRWWALGRSPSKVSQWPRSPHLAQPKTKDWEFHLRRSFVTYLAHRGARDIWQTEMNKSPMLKWGVHDLRKSFPSQLTKAEKSWRTLLHKFGSSQNKP